LFEVAVKPVAGLSLLSIVAAGALACGTPPAHAPRDDAAAIAVPIERVTALPLTSYAEAGGVVRARATAVIASRIMAPVLAVHVRAGDHVRRGAVLVTLDARDSAANRARAEAALGSARESMRAAESDAQAAEAAVALARATHDRIRTLHAKRSATSQELDQAVAALDGADAQWRSAQARVAAAASAREAAQAAMEAASIETTYATLTAPFDGVVTERSVDPGSMAQPGAPLLTVEEPSAFRLEVPVDEAHAATIGVGTTAGVQIGDGGAARWIDARVGEVARIDPASHSFVVKLDLPAGSVSRSGVFGRARFTGAARRALAIPSSAVVRRGQLTFAFVIDNEGRARLQPVSIGTAEGGRAEVLAGLREGDRIVANPPPALSDGMRVTGGSR
jgi:multidrug efflux pump subunit AcrA (membrane-fusion protein)